MTAIDLFAGLGGFTQGALQAGVRVVFAANHSPTAVEYHRRNHPEVTHACQDLQQFPFEQLPKHDILLGSPCCQGHSRGRWRDRSYDASRSTAWAIVSALEVARPGLAIVENVPEIRRWELFDVWLSAIRRLGYSVAAHNYDAAVMRMVQPSEARAAMSFPPHYLLPSNKAEANHLLGNAVPPLMAEAVIRAVLEAA